MRYATYLKCQCRAIFANTSINCIYENETLTLAVRELLGGGKEREGKKKKKGKEIEVRFLTRPAR